MEGLERDIFGALSDGAYDASLHFTGGFVSKRQAQDIFTGKARVGLEEMANALGDDSGLAGSGASDDQQGAIGMSDGATLRVIELQAGIGEGLKIKKSAHRREPGTG